MPRPTCFREHGEVPDVDVLNGILVNDASLDDMLFVVIFRTSWAQKAPRYDGDDEVVQDKTVAAPVPMPADE